MPQWKIGDRVVYHGDLTKQGGFAEFAVQLAKLEGKQVISTASPHNHEYVKSLGADFVLDYRDEYIVSKVLSITNGRGVDAVIDTVSAQSATTSLEFVAFLGHIVHIAGAPDYTKIKPFTKSISYHEVALGAAHQSGDRMAEEALATIGEEMLSLLAKGSMTSMLKEVVGLEEVPTALARLSERHVKGKIVAKIK